MSITNEKHLNILEWIFPGSFETRHKDISERRAPGSGRWFMNHEKAMQWIECDKSEVLFCVGNRKLC
jgi:hypothetical protein